MKILLGLTYYRPHLSGLTIYVQRLAEALAERGHTVTVLTSRHAADLPLRETINGVRVARVPVALRLSKGPLMPGYAAAAARLVAGHDLVVGNLPSTPIEAFLLPALARRAGRPVAMTYHCDLNLPSGPLNRIVDQAVFASNLAAVGLSDRVVAYTDDYARHSRVLRRFPRKRVVIPPPVDLPIPSPEQVEAFRRRFDLAGCRPVGFVARLATEKGVEYALEALRILEREEPSIRILFAGEHRRVIGEEAYGERLEPLLGAAGDRWQFTGVLSPTEPAELASFYAACELTILPSVNMTESFGLVQVESMLCGTPVVASGLPGVRQPISVTGMGRIVPPRDARALAGAILEILRNREAYVKPRAAIAAEYSIPRTAGGYERLFASLDERRRGGEVNPRSRSARPERPSSSARRRAEARWRP